MPSAIRNSATLTLADDLAQPSRLLLARSQSFALVRNGASDSEVRATMSDALSTELAEARRGIQVALATVHGLSDEEQQAFLGEIAGFIALTGGGWPAEQRGEFIDQAAADLSEIPVRLLAPAIREARRRVWEPKRFVSWVHEFVSRDHGRLIEERDTIEKLARIVETTEVAPA